MKTQAQEIADVNKWYSERKVHLDTHGYPDDHQRVRELEAERSRRIFAIREKYEVKVNDVLK